MLIDCIETGAIKCSITSIYAEQYIIATESGRVLVTCTESSCITTKLQLEAPMALIENVAYARLGFGTCFSLGPQVGVNTFYI